MFAMLSGRWPRVLVDGTRLEDLEAEVRAGRRPPDQLVAAVELAVDLAISAQIEGGLGLVHDGSVRWADPWRTVHDALLGGDTGPGGLLVRAWRATAGRTGPAAATVAAVVPGPCTLAAGAAGWAGVAGGSDGAVDRAGSIADELAAELEALAGAGCPVVVVDEPAAVAIGEDAGRRAGFRDAHRRLLARAGGLHTMLAVTGGSAAAAGADTILAAPYASYLFDLAAGPDNWHLVRAAPAERGIVVAALEAGDGRERRDQAPELVWAAQYAASAGGRGLARVGLANASPLGGLTLDEARAALAALGRAAGLAGLPVADAVRAGLDPRVMTRGTVPAPGSLGAPGDRTAPGDPPARPQRP